MPDPLEPLFSALESINDELTTFAARLARLEDARSVAGSGGPRTGADEGDARVPGAPVVWHDLPERAREDCWATFTGWVVRIADSYELTTEQLPRECWWEHGAVVAELTALWTGWESAYGTEDDAAAGPYLWHDAFSRGIERIGRMWLGECTNGYHNPKSRQSWGRDADLRKRIQMAGPPNTGELPRSIED